MGGGFSKLAMVLEGTCNKGVCSGVPRSVTFDGHLSQRSMHQKVLLLDFIEGKLKRFVDDALNISLSVHYVKKMAYLKRFVYGTYTHLFFITQPARSVGWVSSRR